MSRGLNFDLLSEEIAGVSKIIYSEVDTRPKK